VNRPPPGDDVLMIGPWPDPRAGGVCSAGYDCVKGLVEAGRDVLLVCPCPGTNGPESLYAAAVPAGPSYDWRRAAGSFQTFRDFRHLAAADRLGAFPGGADRLADVGVVHAQLDDLLSRPGEAGRPARRYETLAVLVESRAGARPTLVRTYHIDVDQVLELVMSLSGVDYVALPEASKRAILDGAVDLRPLTSAHVAANRAELRATRWGDEVLDHAGDHVAFNLDLLRRWRDEVRTIDAAVCTTPREALQREAQLLPDRPGVLRHVWSGTSFRPNRPQAARAWLRAYRKEGFPCWRGASEGREGVRFGPDERVVLFVGRAVREKGVYELASALRHIYHEFGFVQLRGVFVGDFGPDLRAELASVDPAHSDRYVFFTGYQCDADVLASLYTLADVLAIPSYYETFGLVAVEAMRLGTPCVVTEATSACDAFVGRPGRDGVRLALPVGRPHPSDHRRYTGVDPVSLACQLFRLLSDDGLAAEMGAAGRDYARTHYTHRTVAEGYLRIYDERPGPRAASLSPPRDPASPEQRSRTDEFYP